VGYGTRRIIELRLLFCLREKNKNYLTQWRREKEKIYAQTSPFATLCDTFVSIAVNQNLPYHFGIGDSPIYKIRDRNILYLQLLPWAAVHGDL
jgi:hypothetical protein